MSEATVTTKLSNTVLRRPIRDINNPVGTEKIKNQKNTIPGKTLAAESDRLRSFCT